MSSPKGQTGIVIFASISMLVVGGSALLAAHHRERTAGRAPSSDEPALPAESGNQEPGARAVEPPPPAVGTDDGRPATAGTPEQATSLIERLVVLFAGTDPEADEAQIARLSAELVALGENASPLLVQKIDALGGVLAGPQRDRLLDVLRRMPGRVAEDRLIKEARSGRTESSRVIAIDALSERRTQRAVDTLSRIAETDPDLPEKPLITSPRDPNDPSTELPDEVVFTPRMQAMAALAATGDPRAAQVLTGVLRDGPDESLRMEAARNLESLRDVPGTVDALRAALTKDASPYVRLAALHALAGSTDRGLAPMLQTIAERDGDAGVRALAQQVLASLGP
jgi:HEAT repeat protein